MSDNALTVSATPSVDESAVILTTMLRAKEPFFFIRLGDGALECLAGRKSMTRDSELYTPELAGELRVAWAMLSAREGLVYVGDWQSASFDQYSEPSRYADQYAGLFKAFNPHFLHFESLLLMRKSAELVDFYRAVKEDTRRKLYMGPISHNKIARALGAKHVVIPMTPNLHRWFKDVRVDLAHVSYEFDVLLYGAGMAGNIPVIKCWAQHPERTYINLGSALDPLAGLQTRSVQLLPAEARTLFGELL
jgi:hypothetical protein